MAYFGKEFAVENSERYEEFIKSLGLSEELTAKYTAYKPKVKIEKNGDQYTSTSITSDGSKATNFTPGVEYDEPMAPGVFVKSKYIVEGDTITQVLSKDDKTITFKREYSENALKVTITASFFEGASYRYYKAV